jgi:hypothetical protein
MSHHYEDSSALRKILGVPDDLGATGRYPNGKLGDGDEGEIKIGIARHPAKDIVLIDFGKPVAGVGLTPDEAVGIAEMLRQKAWECRGSTANK